MTVLAGEKTQKPSPKRLRDLRRIGQVPQSRDFVSALVTLGFFVLFFASLPDLIDRLEAAVLLPVSHLKEDFAVVSRQLLKSYIHEAQSIVAPFLGVVLIIGVGANLLQNGVLFFPAAVVPSLKRLNPSQNIKRILSLQSLVELAKSVVKVLILGLVLMFVLRERVGALISVPGCGMSCLRWLTGRLLIYVASCAGLSFLVLAMADLAFQRWQFARNNRMSRDEVKRELKEDEGDPLIKAERKKVLAQIAQSRRATVLITNPTHIAIAIYYDRQHTPLPLIDAIGTDLVARRMIDAAAAAGVPVMRSVPLARALLEDGLVDECIPSHLIEPVAAVLRAVGELAPQTAHGP
ncbi:EscU/YscU/HrcU family type III secretion system export apparatus switch protein [Bradyrhizobium sp. CB3481]|uniref:EscU/YscU/HrcU family type III secretion system export apparatus switch protein n=1 Tax=Bradyrhizobium sp. CB3481 TaxID=3039158 RepID=UPI0024B27C47|nr:EscU/YscU/HrcU family type III secretion system export apparatus switch protein [Bradyrhizobium sp. CB3481]WFU14910.1 EscU/YscU/HrcU family type III secretion system export apparatus switch protein [Bradyrhizobium sp. CB3481]